MVRRIVMLAVGALILVPCTLNAMNFRGVLKTLTSQLRIDSLTFSYFPPPDTTFATPSWGGAPGMIDTFAFSLSALPNGPVVVYPGYRAQSYPPDTFPSLQPGTWHTVRTPVDTAVVMFEYATTVEERPPAGPVRLEVASANPSTGQVAISYRLPAAGSAELVVTNVIGKTEKTLVAGRQVAGRYAAIWDGTDNFRHAVDNGVYFVRLRTNSGSVTRKLILAR